MLTKTSNSRDEYSKLKEDLLKKKSSYEKNNSLFTGYNLGKDAFIRKILKAANFSRIRMMKQDPMSSAFIAEMAEMPFEDPSGEPANAHDIAMGKQL